MKKLQCYCWLILCLTTSLCFGAHAGKNGRIGFIASFTGSPQIYTINPDGTGIFQVTNLPSSPEGLNFFFDFSPDGRQIVFDNDMTGQLELWLINVDGTNLRQLTHDTGAGPCWSPDGTRIAYTPLSEIGYGLFASINVDGTDRKLLGNTDWESLGCAWTPDGRIVYSTRVGGYVSADWIIKADGTHAHMLTPPEIEAGPPDVSPDGKQVIFYIHQDTPKDTSIYSLDVATREITPLTGPHHQDVLPAFSPDSTQILFMSDRQSAPNFDIFIMNRDGSNKRLLIEGGSGPKWSPEVSDDSSKQNPVALTDALWEPASAQFQSKVASPAASCVLFGKPCYGPGPVHCCAAPFPHHSFCSSKTGWGRCLMN